METIVTPGLVLKETRYKESDRILTILTPAGCSATRSLFWSLGGICIPCGKRL